MSKYDITELNNEQLAPLQHTEGPVLVTAGAGSGKTRLLTHRIVYLIQEKGILPSNILAITFTNKAANEMKERIESMVEDGDKIWISTFHSMCCKILRKNIKNLDGFDSNFSIYSESDKDKAIKSIIEKMDLSVEDYKNEAGYHISNAKNENLSPWDYQKFNQYTKDIDIYTKIYAAYQQYLKSNNSLDFDDLLVKVYELFVNCPDILSHYQNRFEYIFVDEFQDTNTIQYLIVKLLASKSQNIFVVGDEDQCIYGWRGANINNILSFKKDFPNCKIYKLEQNYRSTKQILNAGNNLIKNNSSRLQKVLWTSNVEGVKVDNFLASNESDEAEFVANTIHTLVDNNGYKYSDFAVLMRLNALTRPFEEAFLKYNIPHRIFGGFKFFERQEIKDIIAYLRVFVNPQDSTSLFRIINVPKRGIGDGTIRDLNELTEIHSVSPLNLIFNCDEFMLSESFVRKISPFRDILQELDEAYHKLPPKDFVELVIKRTGMRTSYEMNSEDNINKVLNIDAFVQSVSEYFEANPNMTLVDYLESITLISDIDSYDDQNNAVAIATVHSAKGLEFRVVFIVGLEEKYFPIMRSNGSSDMEEERRLMYVAITRAKERLYLTRCRTRFMYGKRDYCVDSRFLKECGALEDKPARSYDSKPYQQAFQPFGTKVSFSLDNMSQSKPQANTQGTKNIEDFGVGKQVLHTKFGVGTIKSVDTLGRCLTVDFGGYGAKTLLIDYAPIKVINAEDGIE